MKLAILSDIHGNLEALREVLAQCAGAGVDRMLCLGDVVGYGADPNGCVKQVREAADAVLAGNHDWAAVGLADPRFFNPVALAAIRWTAAQLAEAHAAYLRECPITLREGEVDFVHASPYQPEAWHYIHSSEEAGMGLAHTDARIVFVGHSHRAFIYAEGTGEEVAGEGTVRVDASERYLVNVGSVGQPRDGDPRAAFAIWDRAADELHLCRVPYDVAGAQAKIRAAHLPEWLAERLALGC